MWPFRRNSPRKRARSDTDDDVLRPLPSSISNPPASAIGTSSTMPARRRSVQKRSNKLQGRRAYSFESGRADSIGIGSAGVLNPGASRSDADPIGYFYVSGNDSGLAEDVLHHNYNPTLRQPSKRDGQQLYRTKGSKRRKNANDLEREAELKAMSRDNVHNLGKNLTPLRPAAEQWSAGRLMKKETIKAHGSFRRRHGGELHPSDVSLPLAESIDSAMSSDSEQIAYTVSSFAALAPKPTLRYTPQQHPAPAGGRGMPQRLPSQRRKLTLPISEAVLKAHKRVDDLADDLDASDLRELMERDQRRRERKRQREQERVAQRLRRAEQQPRDADNGSSAAGPSTSANLVRGVLGREAASLGIDTTSAVVTSSTRRHSAQALISPPASPLDHEHQLQVREQKHHSLECSVATTSVIEEDLDIDMVSNECSASSSRRRRSPVEDFYRPESIPEGPAEFTPPPSPPKAVEEMKRPSPIPQRTNSKLRQLIKLSKRQSGRSSLGGSERTAKPSASFSLKTSESSLAHGALSWGSLVMLFRWRLKAKHGAGPSSFSNLSRDSMTAQAPPRMQAGAHSHWQQHSQQHSQSQLPIQSNPPVAAVPSEKRSGLHPMKVGSGVHRTLSRFREDLPDFLMSPPASRHATPEVEPVPPLPEHTFADEQMQTLYFDEGEVDEPIIPTTVCVLQHESEQLRTHSSQGSTGAKGSMRDTPTSWLRTDDKPSPEPQPAMSLASIDSEGSWLSGRVAKRRVSAQSNAQVLSSLDNIARSFPKPPQSQHNFRYRRSWTSIETGESSEQPVSPVSFMTMPAVAATRTASDLQMTDADDMSAVAEDTASVSTAAFQRNSAGELRSSSDEEDDEEGGVRWGSVGPQTTAAIVTIPATKAMKSSEVLKSFIEDENGAGSDSMDSPVSLVSPVSMADSDFRDEEAGVQRATSVNLGKGHARHISAGSAKLLDISPRDSVDAKGQTSALM